MQAVMPEAAPIIQIFFLFFLVLFLGIFHVWLAVSSHLDCHRQQATDYCRLFELIWQLFFPLGNKRSQRFIDCRIEERCFIRFQMLGSDQAGASERIT